MQMRHAFSFVSTMIWYRAQELKRVGRWQDQVGYCVDKVVC